MSALADIILALPEDERRKALASLPVEDLAALEYHWPVWARDDQLPPDNDLWPLWRTWLYLAGRGAGKTRAAAEAIRAQVEAGRRRSIVLISPTADTGRRDQIAAILNCSPHSNMPVHEPSQRRLVWPNDAQAYSISGEEPERLRGINADFFWIDEFCAIAQANQAEIWSNLQLALRISGPLGDRPQGVITTTPKRSTLLRSIMNDATTVVTRASTFANRANLDPATLRYLDATYGGSTLGRQELEGEILDDSDAALWKRAMFDKHRVTEAPELRRIIVAVDPAGGSSKKSDETGIVACGIAADKHVYVLRDASGRYSPEGWARRAIQLHDELRADAIIAEQNFGGEMVQATLKATGTGARIKMVTASRGKQIRAEPIVSAYEQGRVHHVGNFPELEDQCCGWEPLDSSFSPDRLDALVWACTELAGGPQPIVFTSEMIAACTPAPGTEGWRRMTNPWQGSRR